ncbi:ninjurin-2-like [Glandiceps talaboti]
MASESTTGTVEMTTTFDRSGSRRRRKNVSINAYVMKKTATQGLFDAALLTSNATLLRMVVESGPEVIRFYHLLLGLIGTSLVLQFIIALILFAKMRVNIESEEERHQANDYNDFATLLVCFITVLNIMIGSFSSDHKFVDSPVIATESPPSGEIIQYLSRILEQNGRNGTT